LRVRAICSGTAGSSAAAAPAGGLAVVVALIATAAHLPARAPTAPKADEGGESVSSLLSGLHFAKTASNGLFGYVGVTWTLAAGRSGVADYPNCGYAIWPNWGAMGADYSPNCRFVFGVRSISSRSAALVRN